MMRRCSFWIVAALLPFIFQVVVMAGIPSQVVDCYTPTEGGWRIRISDDPNLTRLKPGDTIGVVQDNPRLHRRPLYPPADRSMIWNHNELKQIERVSFRPLVLAYNEPRFLFDLWTAGGLLGHLFIGLVEPDGPGKWFHEWSELEVRYVNGRMEYTLQDKVFPGVSVELTATPLDKSAGLAVMIHIKGLSGPATLIWAYGGASAFTTNYNMTAPEFTFAPEQCKKDSIRWENGTFALRRPFDDSDVYKKPLPDWKAVIQGGSSVKGEVGFGNPEDFPLGPDKLAESIEWVSSSNTVEHQNCVAVQRVPLGKRKDNGNIVIVIGMGGNIEKALRAPANAYGAALARNKNIAERIVTHTPDPYLDSAMRMMAFATDGLWGDTSILHGGWSWRFAYLGWRGWYGPVCYGWTDRVKKSIQNHTKLGLIREGPDQGALCHMLESNPTRTFYNMNEVFLDQVRQYFDYTNDLELMREIFPVLEGILEWENRRLRPGDEYLYENSLNTWISDSHWYIRGQCTQASAYMLGTYKFMADLAGRLGKDAKPFQKYADSIQKAMQERLWMPQQGVFAEYLDTTGNRMLHTEPELPTIYHSAEFGAADDLQIAQMLHWADTHLGIVSTPGHGKQYWSSNWFPNHGRS
ncbi:MAG: DUF4450 domain-containing protein, partial [bacterium]